jgi:pyruvate/2-oxoglutarate dehydrogenase complex dihydrolipoamide acyltransferase (E2) component
MSWYVSSTHLETLHDGRMVGAGEEASGVDPELDKELIDRGALYFVRSEDEPEPTAATDAALILIQEHELDIADISGTGKDGRITEPDVRKALENATAGEDNQSSSQDEGEQAEAVAPEPAAVPQKEDSK